MDKILSSSHEVGLCEDDIEELKGLLLPTNINVCCIALNGITFA